MGIWGVGVPGGDFTTTIISILSCFSFACFTTSCPFHYLSVHSLLKNILVVPAHRGPVTLRNVFTNTLLVANRNPRSTSKGRPQPMGGLFVVVIMFKFSSFTYSFDCIWRLGCLSHRLWVRGRGGAGLLQQGYTDLLCHGPLLPCGWDWRICNWWSLRCPHELHVALSSQVQTARPENHDSRMLEHRDHWTPFSHFIL